MALSLLQRLCKQSYGLGSSVRQSVNVRLILSNPPSVFLVNRVPVESRRLFTRLDKYGWKAPIPALGVRWQMTSGPWSLAAGKKPKLDDDDKRGSKPHTTLWAAERLTGIILMVVMPLDLMFQSSVLEITMAICAVLHGHWGYEGVLRDYCRPAVVGKFLSKAADIVLIIVSVAVFLGLVKLISGPGISETIKLLWDLNSD